MSSSHAAALQAVIDKIAEVRSYRWDTSPYEPVASWEASALAAVREAFGMDSGEAKELSTAIADEAWKNTNRPDAVSPEVFVNRDFQARIDNIEKMLRGYLTRIPTETVATSQKPRKARHASASKRKTIKKKRVKATAKKGRKKASVVKRRKNRKRSGRSGAKK